jgi:thiol:disulfide interchange protein DsbD
VSDLIRFTVTVDPKTVRRGQTALMTITGKVKPGYHTFALLKSKPNQFVPQLKYEPPAGVKVLHGNLKESDPELVNEDGTELWEHTGTFTWKEPIWVLPEARPGPATLKFSIRLQVCDKQRCVPGTMDLQADFTISAEPPVSLSEEERARLEAAARAPAGGGGGDSGLLGFVLMGVFWGFFSLITPCVFPMIPITVSFFLKQSEKEHHRPVTMAVVYCSTIIVVLTIAAVALLSVFRQLSTSPVMNFVIGGLFIFFALSLFGMYDIELPSGLARFTSAREGRGGLLGTMFMALTFTIISFACVAPFLGGFGGTAAGANQTFTHRLLGGLAFAVTFASPFFVLALFPSLLKRLPKSGSWLNAVKVVMGFLELAAALKFLRAGELVMLPEPAFLTYDFVLGLYVALSVLCGLYLLGLYRLPHDSPVENLSVPRMLFSLLFLGLALYLTPALFKYGDKGKSQRPGGTVFAWLDSFLLPDEEESDLPVTGNLAEALKKARAEKKLVFVDFTGKTCTNCKLNEKNVFTLPTVRDKLKQYVLVQLYTDVVPRWLYPPAERGQLGGGTGKQRADAQANLDFQRKEFNTETLPLYVVLEPLAGGKFRELARFEEGKIGNVERFLAFLDQPLEDLARALAAAAPDARGKAPAPSPAVPAKGKPPAPAPAEAAGTPPKQGPPPAHAELSWVPKLDQGLREAQKRKSLVFVDFTGVACLNCAINERNVFSKPEVQDLLRRYTRVRLYTDVVPDMYYSKEELARSGPDQARQKADAAANLKLESDQFQNTAQPLYVILRPLPDGKSAEVARFDKGRIRDAAEFLRFLREPLAGGAPGTQALLKRSP